MNIKITKDEFDYVYNQTDKTGVMYIVGSRLYGTNRVDSDYDYLIVHDSIFKSDNVYKNYHQLQYDDVDKNIQYIFTTKESFWGNLLSGDSSINADVILFYADFNRDEKLNICRTSNIIKAFIGFAKRDIKYINKGKNKLFHIERSLYCAECLLNNELPNRELYDKFGKKDLDWLKAKEQELRARCNEMFDKGELTMYPVKPIFEPINDLEKKIIEANNIREFKY